MKSWQETIPTLKGITPQEKRSVFDQFLRYWDEGKNGPFPVWEPSKDEIEKTNIFSMMKDLKIFSYKGFHQFSVDHRDAFWEKTLDKIGIIYKKKYENILDLSDGIEFPKWLKGAKLNIADSCFKAASSKNCHNFPK